MRLKSSQERIRGLPLGWIEGFTINKEEIAEYALTTETTDMERAAIRITPKRFICDGLGYSNKKDDDFGSLPGSFWNRYLCPPRPTSQQAASLLEVEQCRTFSIVFLNSDDRNKLKTFLDEEPSVNDATNTESTIDRPNLIVGGKIMKYKLNKKSKSILSNRLSKRRKTSKRRKISKRRNKSKRKKISKRRNKSKRYQ